MSMIDLSQEPASKQDVLDLHKDITSLESRIDKLQTSVQSSIQKLDNRFVAMEAQLGSVKWMVPIVSATNVALIIVMVGLVSGFMGKMLGWY